jgi:hypothetical protein
MDPEKTWLVIEWVVLTILMARLLLERVGH